jgi:flavin reductase (DIM6/NTAB) family NADH-FMN oxidoreductase RutF
MPHDSSARNGEARPRAPSILYFGTPVILVSTRNPDASANLAPLSSVFWLGWRCVIGANPTSRTSENLLRERECVVNMPSASMVGAVDALALTTGSDPVPENKARRGYRHLADKFSRAGLTPAPAQTVAAPRVQECPVQMECTLVAARQLGEGEPGMALAPLTFELRVTRVWLADEILAADEDDRVDPDKWRPLMMSFQKFYGLGQEVAPSRLATIPERLYRGPDRERARCEPMRAPA